MAQNSKGDKLLLCRQYSAAEADACVQSVSPSF